MRLREKIALPAIATVVVVTGIAFLTIGIFASDMSKKRAYEIADRTASEYSYRISADMERGMIAARTLAQAFSAFDSIPVSARRGAVDRMIWGVKSANPYMLGVWSVVEMNVFGGDDMAVAGREDLGTTTQGLFIDTWYRGEGDATMHQFIADIGDVNGATWYEVPKTTYPNETMVEPAEYAYFEGGHPWWSVSIVAPITRNGGYAGTVGIDISLEEYSPMLDTVRPLGTGVAYVVSNAGLLVTCQDRAKINHPLDSLAPWRTADVAAIKAGKGLSGTVRSLDGKGKVYRVLVPMHIGSADQAWGFVVELPLSTVFADARTLFWLSIISLLITVGMLGGVLYWIVGMFTAPVSRVAEALKDIAQGEGDLTRRIEASSDDEVGELARWFNLLLERIADMVRAVSADAERVAESSSALSTAASGLMDSSADLSLRSVAVSAAVEQSSTMGDGLANSAASLSGEVRTVAAAVEEMNASLSEVARNCQSESTQTTAASHKVRSAREQIDVLAASAREVAKIVDTIADIADQTNLLALNATIEAASAGDAGRGFSVVAGEEKDLARQTAASADQIRRQVESMLRNTASSVKSVGDIETIISEVEGISRTIASAVEEQSATVGEIAGSIGTVSGTAEGMAGMVGESAAGLTEISGAVAGVKDTAGATAAEVGRIRERVSELETVAATLRAMVGRFRV